MFAWAKRAGLDPQAVTRTKTWRDPLRWQRAAANGDPRKKVFTCSLSDWFHEDADPWRDEAWEVIRSCPDLVFQILTKRPENIASRLPADWGAGYPNVWLGVSVENRRHGLPRIPLLRAIPAAIRFLSIEPLLEDLGSIDLGGIDWVIVGGESGSGWRRMDHAWARAIRDQCRAARVLFFFKQSAGSKPETGTLLDGQEHREIPQ
jgi:protein gp37